MSLFSRDNDSRFTVSIVSHNEKNDAFAPKTKKGRIAGTVSNIFQRAVAGAILLAMTLLGLIGTAAPANADGFIEDGFKAAFCSSGMSYYDLETRSLAPNTANPKSPNATAYEKYGMAGTNWTTWLGPEQQEGLDDAGEFGGVDIVNFAGGPGNNGGIDKWGDEVDSKSGIATKYPEFYNAEQTCASVLDNGTTLIGNLIMDITGLVVYVTNLILQAAYETSSSVMTYLEPVIINVVETLRDALYLGFLIPMITVSAVGLAITGLVKRRFTEFAQQVMWMLAACTAGFTLLASPMLLPNTVNGFVSYINQGVITKVTSSGMDDVSKKGNMCYVNNGPVYNNVNVATGKEIKGGGSKADRAARKTVRVTQCVMWKSFIYTPWAEQQFGDDPAGKWGEIGNVHKDGEPLEGTNMKDGVLVAGQNITGNWALSHLDNKVVMSNDVPESERVIKQRELLNIAAAQLHTDTPNRTYKGEQSQERMLSAILAMIAAMGASLMVVVISFSIIILNFGVVLLTLFSALFLLCGIQPTWGRKILLGWFEILLGLALKSVVLSLFLGVMLLFYFAVLSSEMPWIIACIMIIAVSYGGFTYKKEIVNMVSKVSLGSNGFGGKMIAGARKPLEEVKHKVQKVSRTAATAAATAAGGPAAGAAVNAATSGGAGDRPKNQNDAASKIADSASKPDKGTHHYQSPAKEDAPRPRKNSQSSNRKAPVQQNADNSDAGSENTETIPTTAGAGNRPMVTENAVPAESNAEDTEQVETAKETAGAGNRPVSEQKDSATPETLPTPAVVPAFNMDTKAGRKDARKVTKIENSRIKKSLAKEGYRSRTVGKRTIAKAAIKGLVIAKVTGDDKLGMNTAMSTVRRDKAMVNARNDSAYEKVQERERENYAQNQQTAVEQVQKQREAKQARRATVSKMAVKAVNDLDIGKAKGQKPVRPAKATPQHRAEPAKREAKVSLPNLKPKGDKPDVGLPKVKPAGQPKDDKPKVASGGAGVRPAN